MTVHLHDYGQVGIGAGGAPINYAEVSRLILATRNLAPHRHDFHALVADGSTTALRLIVQPGDTLVCTAGPYAHLYHYWREQSGLDFRIVRDARTTAWAPYLAQEWLAAPLLRPGDALVLPSNYARTFYQRLFPHLAVGDVCVLYPLADHLPIVERGPRVPGPALRIGCLGRIADDKNSMAAFDLLRRVQQDQPAELHVAGAFYPGGRELPGPECIPELVTRFSLAPESVLYHGDLPYPDIWRFLGDVDVLYFPAVSSIESFGRVLLEAGRAGVPVVATDYAAAAELVPAPNLVPVQLRPVTRARLTRPLSLGDPGTAAAAILAQAEPAAVDHSHETRYSSRAFLDLVGSGRVPAAEPLHTSAGVQKLFAALRVDGISPLTRAEALGLCADQLRFMRSLHHPHLRSRLPALTRMLRHLPGDPMLQRVARERLMGASAIAVLRNAVASVHVLGFDPRLSLDPA